MCRSFVYLASFLVVLSLAFVSPANGELVAWWKLDDGSGTVASDSSGNGHDGTLLLDPQWVPGKFGGALEFAGLSGQRVEIEGYDGVLGTQNRTVMAWVKTAGFGDWISYGQNVTSQKWIGRINDNAGNGAVGALRTECSGGYIISTTVVNDDEWHHLAAVLESDGAPTIFDITMYVDGAPEEISGSKEVTIDTVGGRNVWIADGHHDRPLPGLIDDVRLYDHAMTQAEVLAAMAGGTKYPYALGPDPKDGTVLADTWVILGWSPGDMAVSHDVYLGDNFDDVNNATAGAPEFVGNQTATMLTVGFPGFPYPDGLAPGTTYYWRIDEVNEAEPNSPWKGNIWSFSVPPQTAYNPDPADGAESVPLDATFTWTPGYGAKLHTVYMDTDFDIVNNAAGGAPLGTADYKPASLEAEKVYYWRVDEFDAVATYKGDVWGFTTPGAAGSLSPANGAVDVQINSTLSWTPAANAVSHDLYLGQDKDAVRNATTASPEFKGNKALGSESYDPGKLAWDSDYYWRVDAVYSTGTVKGLVWSFTTADFITVDDFESYNDVDPPDPNSNRIFESWIDGFGTTDNGALVGNDLPPYAEQTIVHGGAQSMPYFYDNTLKTSEASLTLVYPRDWTEEGVRKLSLWFRGASANAADKIYVALNGNAVVYHDNATATQIGQWKQWVIDLQAFADQGVNLANVNTITIGIGTKGSPAAGGMGTMYFDDIRLIR